MENSQKKTDSYLYFVIFFLFAALMAATIYNSAYDAFVGDELVNSPVAGIFR